MAAEFPDLQTKMSKKIAQLTKVIYQLNTQNEDHQIEKETMLAQHAREIEEIVADATGKIDVLSRSLAARHEEVNLQAQLDSVKQKYDVERETCLTELAQLRRDAKKLSEDTSADYVARVNAVRDEVSDAKQVASELKGRFDAAVTELERARTNRDGEAAAELASLKEAHAAELRQLNEATLKKSEATLAAHLEACESLRAQACEREKQARAECARENEQRIGQLRAELAADHQASLMTLERQLDERLRAASDSAALEGAKLRGDSDVLRTDLQAAQREVSSANEELSRLRTALEVAQNELERLRKELIATRGDASSTENELAKRLRKAEEAGVRLEHEVSSLKGQLKDKGTLLGEEREKRQNLEATHAHFTKKMTDEMVERDAQLAQLSGDIERLTNALAQHQANAAKACSEAAEILGKEYKRNEALEIELKAARAQGGVLEAGRVELEAAIQAKEAEWEKRLHELETRFEQREREQAAAHVSALRVNEESHRAQAEAAKAAAIAREQEHAEATRKLTLSHSEALAMAAEAAARGEAAAQKTIARLEEELSAEKKQLKANVDQLKSEGAALKKALTASNDEVELWKNRNSDAEKKIKELKKDAADAKLAAERQLKSRTEQLEAEWGSKLGTLAADSAAGIDVLKSEFERHKKNAEEKLAADLDAQRRSLEDASRQQLRELEAKLEEEKKRFEEAAAAAEYLRLRDAQGLEAERARHSQEVDALRAEHEEQMKAQAARLRASAEADKASLEAAHTAEMQATSEANAEAATRTREAHVQELSKTASTHRASVERTLQEHEREVGRLTREAQQGLSAALAQQKGELEAVAAAEAARVATAFDAERAEMQQKTDALHDTVFTQEERCNELRANVARIQEEAREAHQEHERMLAEAAARAEVDARETSRLHAQELDELSSKSRFEQENLEARLAALQHKWETREGRPEDLNRIRELEEDVAEKERLVRKTLEDMAYFKRELLNREENFNKRFGANPNVGVMQVIKPSKQQNGTKSGSGRRGSSSVGGGNRGASQQHPAGPVLGGPALGVGGIGKSLSVGRM